MTAIKILWIISALCFVSPCLSSAELAQPDATSFLDNEKIILALPPDQISEEQFYAYEHAIISGYSGSGGYYLEQAHINWILKMEKFFKSQGVELKDNYGRDMVIADSYENVGDFAKAMLYYQNANMPLAYAQAEWRLHNEGRLDKPLKILAHSGKIPGESDAVARREDERYLFTSFFKGPVVRYDKQADEYAVIFVPDQYEWAERLELFEGGIKIFLRLNSGVYEFDNDTMTISKP